MKPRKNNPFLSLAPLAPAAVVIVSFASAPNLLAGDPLNVATDLPFETRIDLATSFDENREPAATDDIIFNATSNYDNNGGSGQYNTFDTTSVGSINILGTTPIRLGNGNVGTAAPWSFNGNNAVSGNAADLFYVAPGATATIFGFRTDGDLNTVSFNPVVSGNLNIAGTAEIEVPIASGSINQRGTNNNLTPSPSALTKTGAGTLTLSSALNNFTGGMTISGGVLQLGAGGARGGLAPDCPIVNDSNLTINRSDEAIQGIDFSGDPITGSGSFTQAGPGTTILTEANTYTGATEVTAGILSVEGSLTSDISVGNLATITGFGSTTGSLTMEAGSNYLASDLGPLEANGVTFSGVTNLIFDILPSGQFTLLDYGAGGVTGLPNLTSNYRVAVVDDVGNSEVLATVTTVDLSWASTDGTWAVGTGGWNGGSDYYDGDRVTFGERPAASVVTLTGEVNPETITVNNSSNPYTFTGGGSIGGDVFLEKDGSGALTLEIANTYSLGTDLLAGTLNINNASAVGTGPLAIYGGMTDNTSGAAIVMTGNILQYWNASFTFTGTNNLDLGRGDVNVLGTDTTVTVAAGILSVGEIDAVGTDLIKDGPGTLEIASAGNNADGSVIGGVLNVAAGQLWINRPGEANHGDFTAGGVIGSGTIANGAAGERWLRLNSGFDTFTFGGSLVNGYTAGLGLHKSGAGTQILTGTNTYTGPTYANGGELVINGQNSGPGTNTFIQGGTLTLGHAQALGTNTTIDMNGNNVSTLNLAIDGDAVGAPYSLKASTNNVVNIVSNRATEGPGVNHTLTNQNNNGFGGATLNFTSGDKVTSGSGRVTFQQLAMGGGSVGTVLLNPTTADVSIVGPVSKQTNNASVTLGLGGTSTGNLISGNISNGPALLGANSVSVVKSNTSTWTLSGANTYTGATTVNAGALFLVGGSLTSNITVADGANLGFEVGSPTTTTGSLDFVAGSMVSVSGAPSATTLMTAASFPSGVVPALNPAIPGWSLEVSGTQLNLVPTSATDYDTWIGGFTFAPGADTTLTGDPDQDGMTNEQEYAFGLIPNSGNSVNPITSALDRATGQFTYTRRKPSLTGLGYSYEFSTTLAGWSSFTPVVPPVSDNGDPIEKITVTAPAEVTNEMKAFIRVIAD